MIPARLSLRNFLCYREPPPLEFAGIQAACLTGENGNGKSALLDAITWALWGKARGKTDGDLISLGATEMEVDFEFLVGEAKYRVQRKLRKTGSKGQTSPGLFFYVWAGEGWTSNTGSVKGETEKRILDVLKLSYQTFINSAFLMQGGAGRFTEATPADRKEVLAEILDLGRYDIFEDRAKERRNERRQRVTSLQTRIGDNEHRLQELPSARAERDNIEAELADLKQRSDDQQATERLLSGQAVELEQVRLRRSALDEDRITAEVAIRKGTEEADKAAEEIAQDEAVVADGAATRDGYEALQRARGELERLEADDRTFKQRIDDASVNQGAISEALREARKALAGAVSAVEGLEERVSTGTSVRERAALLESAQSELDSHLARLDRVRPLADERQVLLSQIATVRNDVERDLREAEAEAEKARSEAAPLDGFLAEMKGAVQEREQVEQLSRDLDALRDEEKERTGSVEQLRTLLSVLRQRGEDSKRKRNELAEALKQGAGDCPLCRSELGTDGLSRIQESYGDEARVIHQEYTEAKARLADAEAAVQALAVKVRSLAVETPVRQQAVQERISGLKRQIEGAQKAAAAVSGFEQAVAWHQSRLEQRDYALNEQRRVEELETEIDAIGYDQEGHERVRTRVAELAGADKALAQLLVAEARLDSARVSVEGGRRQVEQREDELARTTGHIADLTRERAELPLAGARAEVERLHPFQARHDELRAAESRLPERRKRLAALQDQVAADRIRMQQAVGGIAACDTRMGELAAVPGRLQAVREQLVLLSDRISEIGKALGGVDEKIDMLEALEERTRADRLALKEGQRELSLYEELTRGFGKSGVQALIIDSALPEIETAANELLARMTNNRMAVTLKSQKETRQGNVRETLEIDIADEWGTRAYEMYSGGEAFRINLALRIALSKLLARRAGAPLPTLVIDEGFGTQDAAGRERLIEALTAIRDDFQCLLLVTHIDELKDVFDVRIEVVKQASGSVATVVAC